MKHVGVHPVSGEGRPALLTPGLAALALLIAAPTVAAPSYTLLFQRSGYPAEFSATQATPLQHSDAFPVGINGAGSSSFSGSAFAFPGHVGIVNRLETHWTGASAGSRYDLDSKATATDFIITGPTGPWVQGDLHLRVRANLAHVGGYSGNGGHGARLNIEARARNNVLVALGDLTASNYDTHGTGILAGLTDPALDFAFILSGAYPVGTPFDVVIRIFGVETTYGNGGVTPNPGYVLADAGSNPSYGLFLEEVGGHVMTLPAGYTLNSSSWRIEDNHFQTLVGVESSQEPGELRLSAQPNPFTRSSIVSFDQPHAAHVRLQVFDVGGRLVRTLANEWQSGGSHTFTWDGRTDDGRVAESGLYFTRVDAGGRVASGRIVRVRAGN